jgi:hypothetical protein
MILGSWERKKTSGSGEEETPGVPKALIRRQRFVRSFSHAPRRREEPQE